MNHNTNTVDALSKSELFQEYEKAYNEATGLPVAFQPKDSFQVPLHGHRKENPFCALMARQNKTCAACLQLQERLYQKASHDAAMVTCEYGLCEVAVPVKVGNQNIGFLVSGQVRQSPVTEDDLKNLQAKLKSRGMDLDPAVVREAYLKSEVVPQKKLKSLTHLLKIFAEHLGIKSNQLLMQQAHVEPPLITKAKEYIEAHASEELSLNQVATSVHTSPFYFCKLFKKATGLNFTEWVSRARTEKAKTLLINPNLRISEIAYQVGFQSLTHFNRIFKKIVGASPTEYRAELGKPA